jgi:hypothetical protein
VSAHVFAYQVRHGIAAAPSAGRAIRHSCDETSCENWEHLIGGTQPENIWDYQIRRGRETGPLADHRGARGRATAIRDAILGARRNGTSIEEAIEQAISEGKPPRQERLF